MKLHPAGRWPVQVGSVLRELAAGWRAAAVALALFLGLAVVCGLPGATAESNRAISHKVGPLVFLLTAFVYNWRNLRAAAPGPERRFWGKLGAGFGFWSATYVPSLFFPSGPALDSVRPVLDFGFGLAYILVISAFEERPDDRSAITELGRRPSLAHATVMMAAFYTTVVMLPVLTAGEDDYFSSFVFWVAMDLLIAGRLLYFALDTSSRRWRLTYLMLGFSFLLIMAVDLVTAELYRKSAALTSGTFLDALWALPYAFLLTAAATGSLPLEERRGREREPTLSDAFAASPLTWALVFPGLHFLADRTDWLDPRLQPERDLLVIFWTLVLMGVALLRQRRIEQGLENLVHERREIENNLRDSEKDLRLLVERSRVADRLRAAEERFAKAFDVSPEPLVLSIFADGTILDVNQAFERLSQMPKSACIGRRSDELGLWPHSRHRERLVQLLQRRRQMHDLPGELHRADGKIWPVRVSYERISEGDGDLLLTVMRDAASGAGGQRDRIASLLENVRIPLRLVREMKEEGEAASLFVNAGARLAVRKSRSDDVEIAGRNGLRLLLHLKSAENDLL